MFCPGTSKLADGRVLITGGLSAVQSTLYDPRTESWIKTGEMNVPRGYHSQTLLSDGTVFVLGGSWSGDEGGKIGEVYDPATEVWTAKPGIDAAGSMITNDAVGMYRADNHMWLYEATNGKILHVGPAKMMHWLDLTGSGTVSEVA
jgi:galactose oxidase